MANVLKPKSMLDQETITHADVNKIFTDLEDNTDGTTSKIDTTNLRTGAIDREHLSDNVFIGGSNSASNTTEADYFTLTGADRTNASAPVAATTLRSNTGLSGTTISKGEVLRYCGDTMFRRGGPTSGMWGTGLTDGASRVKQYVYLSIWLYLSPTDGSTDYWLQIGGGDFGFSLTNGPYSNYAAANGGSAWIGGYPNVQNCFLRQSISGAHIFSAATPATIDKIVLKAHVDTTLQTVYFASTKVSGMVQRN